MKAAHVEAGEKKKKGKGVPKLKVQELRDEISDAVLNFQLVEVVCDQACNALSSDKNGIAFYICAKFNLTIDL